MVRIVTDPDWERHMERHIHGFLKHIAREVHRDMTRYCPVDSGRLRNDLDWEVIGDTARVGAKTVPYAIYVEEGTSPHTIKANKAQALSWPTGDHPVNSVNHPGTNATFFMRRALYKHRT